MNGSKNANLIYEAITEVMYKLEPDKRKKHKRLKNCAGIYMFAFDIDNGNLETCRIGVVDTRSLFGAATELLVESCIKKILS